MRSRQVKGTKKVDGVRTSADHERKRGLRTSWTLRLGVNALITYGPVPGGGRVRMSFAGARAGST
jgi:hypothetical protein